MMLYKREKKATEYQIFQLTQNTYKIIMTKKKENGTHENLMNGSFRAANPLKY